MRWLERGADMQTGEDIGYDGAIRQVVRTLTHRVKALEEERADVDDDDQRVEIDTRIDEVSRLLSVLKTLHR